MLSESSYSGEMEKRPLLSSKKIPIRRSLLASFLASVMSFASGTVVGGWTAPQHPESVGEMMFMMNSMEISSWVVSIYLIGALLGALPAGQLSRSIGRKKFLLLLAIPMTLGWLLITIFVNHVSLILVGRFLCGLSLGAVTVAVPLYNYDVAPDVCRGRGGVFLDFMLCVGILYSYVSSALLGLRMFAFTCALFPLVFCVLFWRMPESPLYLYSRGRFVDAKAALRWLQGDDCDVSAAFDEYAKLQTEDDVLPADKESQSPGRKRAFVKAVVLSLLLATVQRMSGAGAIIQYTAKLFSISGSSVAPNTASIITGVFQLIGSGITIFLIDRVGRRKLLLVSSSVVVACLAMLTLYFYFLNKGMLENSLKILPIVIVCTFISFFRLGLGPIPWFITTELIGADHSNRAQSCIVSYSWILSFVVMKTFVMLVDEWPVALWLGYTVISVVGYLFVLFFVPETNNKSADEIRLSLAKTYQINSS
ncbi:facilitated trehalose transporter Tret1 [Acyrthosiphon pisum]|uniref:Major facilitator superfamily (MFS) profile domain-containing protein n=1 Tax=Acyrthosiphon pisum TaxID=7029 RepID=A0A8R2F8Z5_ACYPI|nr:facilitated trehalose transporter Tret1 [Acyrthosiphon pisum]XP_029347276.1 facilitated trehalose transporter Tret1 [Acyrthosiphon pisum]|eukprot:XP_008184067.1 PREDICTED: facilitated trehalose transporter Tret1 [Acyrthosiphon pisum]